MRAITIRFANDEDLAEFNKLNGLTITPNTTYLNYTTKEVKVKKPRGIKATQPPSYTDRMKYWKNMPYYHSEVKEDFCVCKIEFEDEMSLEQLSDFFKQKITTLTKSVWFPELPIGRYTHLRLIGGEYKQNIPIYIVSKGRAERCTTSKNLCLMEVPHFVVVEPQEVEEYNKHLNLKYATILELDMSYKEKYDCFDDLGLTKPTGPGPARNFAWDHSIKLGYKWHWVMDDNTCAGFYYRYNNMRIRARTGAIFNAFEDFVQRFDKVAIAGLNYRMFCADTACHPPFVENTRIYSYLLIRNDIPYRWRGRYNEDTDLSLRVLKDGWNTIQSNIFLASKDETQSSKGGNYTEFYSKEGTLPKSQMLKDMHPDVTEVVWKFNRWHHEVDYRGFTKPLEYIEGVEETLTDDLNNYGLRVVSCDKADFKENDNKTFLESKYPNSVDKIWE